MHLPNLPALERWSSMKVHWTYDQSPGVSLLPAPASVWLTPPPAAVQQTEAVTLSYPYLFTWMQHSCIFTKVNAVGHEDMPCALLAWPPHLIAACPAPQCPSWQWLLEMNQGLTCLFIIFIYYLLPPCMWMLSSSNPHIPAEPQFKMKVRMALEVIILLVGYSLCSHSSSSFFLR